MILKGSQRGNAAKLARHLMNVEDNEHVELHELRGFISDEQLLDALLEAQAVAKGTRCQQHLFSLSLNPPEGERVDVATFETAIDMAEQRLGLDGHPRAIVFHEKEGRRHAHAVWSRIDVETMTAKNMPFFKRRLMEVSKELYLQHGWDMPKGIVDQALRNPLNFTRAEWQQAKRAMADPQLVKAMFKQAWQASDNAETLQAALEEKGFFLARGDRRGVVALDYQGEIYALARWSGVKTKDVKAGMAGLLEHSGSAIVLDIKDGELALITARYRRDVLGQNVILIDPYDVAASQLGMERSSFNPCAHIQPFADDAFDDAMLAADSLVIADGGSDSHWSGEAASLIAGLLLHASEHGTASLKAMRRALNASRDDFRSIIDQMLASPFDLVKAAGGRIDNKEERELSGVISTAHRNTHFLESAKLADTLASSDFDPKSIGENTSIYIILPARRIGTARRFLRVLIGSLMASVTMLEVRPSTPVMFLLEEMATLERMAIIEQAVGLMAGFGMQFVMVVQDFTQLKDLYKNRWESFLANSAVIQCFGTNDRFKADYVSALCGQTSLHQLSLDSAMERGRLLGDPDFRSASDSSMTRRLITSDELMSLHPSVQVIALAAARPVIGYRPVYFLEKRFRDRRGNPRYDIHPSRAGQPIIRAVDFTAPGLTLGALLGDYLRVG